MTYSPTISLPDLASWLRSRARVAVLTHIKPDGDAIGSTLALVRAINAAGGASGPRAEVWYFGPQPHWYSAVHGDTPARVCENSPFPPLVSSLGTSEPDGIVICDTGSWQQLEPAAEWLRLRRERAAIVDHHAQGDAEIADRRAIDVSAAAACQSVAELARVLLRQDSLAQLPVGVAEACYLGVMTDTGWCKHSNVSPRVMRTAAELLEAGVNHADLYRRVEQTDQPARLMLLGRALSSLKLDADGKIASMMITQKDLKECRAGPGDAGGFADFGQGLESTRVTAVFTESEPMPNGTPITKISLRSKDMPGSPDVNAVARQFGGGGHVRAAGARINVPITEARELVVRALTVATR